MTIAGVASLALFLAFWTVAPWLASLLRIEDGARLFRIAALDIPFYGLFFIAIALLNGRQRHLAAGVATGCYATVKLAGIAVLAALGPTVEGALVANVVGSAAGLAAATVAIGGRAFVPSLADWRLVLQLALPVSLRGAGVQLLANVGLWALSALGSAADQAAKGLYVAALSIARIPTVTVYGTTGVLIASVSSALAAGDRATVSQLLQGSSRFLLIVLAPACALLCVNAREVITLLFSAEYAGGAGVMVVLVVAQGFFFSIFMGLTGVLIAASKAGHAARVIPWGDGGGHAAVLGPGAGFRCFGRGARHPDRDGRCRGRSRRSGLARRGSLAERAGVRTRLAGDGARGRSVVADPG